VPDIAETPAPIGPPVPASAAETLPLPAVVNLNRWAIADDPDSSAQT
jgi:hypothetical protein